MATQEFTTEELANEIWLPVIDSKGDYSVSCLGRVRRDTNGHGRAKAGLILAMSKDKDGYLKVGLTLNKTGRTFNVHRLVAVAFLGERPYGMEINHIKQPKTNNRASNLEYVTHKKNMECASRDGLVASGDKNGSRLHPERVPRGDRSGSRLHPEKMMRGERVWSAKLTEAKVTEILNLIDGGMRYIPIAKLYGISVNTVGRIKKRQTWLHVTLRLI